MPAHYPLPDDVAALIFDCDGTLVDTPPLYVRAWAAGLRPSGHDMPEPWYRARAGLSEHRLMDAFEAEHRLTLNREDVVRRMREAFLAALPDLREIATIAAIARQVRGRLPLAVASGGSRAIVTATLRATALLDLFDTVVTLDDVPHPKPNPALFLEAANRLAVPPARCLVFEDSPPGLEAAHRAGMRAIDVTSLP